MIRKNLNSLIKRASQKIILLINNRMILCGLALAFTYVVFSALRLNSWIHIWLKGSYYLPYQILFMIIIFSLFLFYVRRYGNIISYKTVIYGIIVGYASGILAYLGAVLCVDYGYQRIVNSLRFSSVWLVLFTPSFWLLSWLFGFAMGLMIVVLSKWSDSGRSG